MKELLVKYAAYNVWANAQLLETILQLPVEDQSREIKSSFKSLYKTVLHLWDAEAMWWQRMKLEERIIRPSENFSGGMKEAGEGLLQQSRQGKHGSHIHRSTTCIMNLFIKTLRKSILNKRFALYSYTFLIMVHIIGVN